MKTGLIAATILVLATGAASAAPASQAGRADTRQFYTCAGSSLSRVSLPAVPHACCEGLLGCPQLLSNTGLVKPHRAGRT